jgi:hypothetical protein
MRDTSDVGGLDRRGFIQLAAAGAGVAAGVSAAFAQPSEGLAGLTRRFRPR